MIIDTFVNFKLRKPWGKFSRILPKGRYDDSAKDFPEEIYEEIEAVEKGSRYTLAVISKETENVNTLASEDTVETGSKSGRKKRTRKK